MKKKNMIKWKVLKKDGNKIKMAACHSILRLLNIEMNCWFILCRGNSSSTITNNNHDHHKNHNNNLKTKKK